MSKMMTVKELCEKLWQYEKELELFELEIQGVQVWELIRFTVFEELSKQLIGVGQAHTSKNKLMHKLKAVLGLLKNSIYRNPFSGNYNVDFLVYDHSRKINIEGKNIDIYTNEFINSNDENKFDVIEEPYFWKHITSKVVENRKYLDHELLTVFLKKKLSPIRLKKEEIDIIEKLQSDINKRFNVTSFDLFGLTENLLNNFIQRFEYHKRLFQKRKPKSIYVVVSYGKIPVIAAAKDLGIEVIEFQHGVITNYHFAYNFSDPTKKLKYFPDKLLTFGEYWAKTDGFPTHTEIEVYGFPHLNLQLERYKGASKIKKQVLFISQGTVGKELSKHAKDIAKSMSDYHFIYKLHPGEYDRWRNEYPDLVDASNLENLEVIDHNEKNLYSFLAESEYQVGVNSTAIFEGMTLNCKTILFNLPGIEDMEDLIDSGIVEVVSNKEDAIRFIENYEVKEFFSDYFFKKV